MADWSATHPYPDKDEMRQCNYCGCQYKLIAMKQDGNNEPEEYHCPECGKEFKVFACNSPRVELISKRTDGRSDRFKND